MLFRVVREGLVTSIRVRFEGNVDSFALLQASTQSSAAIQALLLSNLFMGCKSVPSSVEALVVRTFKAESKRHDQAFAKLLTVTRGDLRAIDRGRLGGHHRLTRFL